jgi:hypothetical protein
MDAVGHTLHPTYDDLNHARYSYFPNWCLDAGHSRRTTRWLGRHGAKSQCAAVEQADAMARAASGHSLIVVRYHDEPAPLLTLSPI